ncbi:TonB-dependent receptor [Planctomycetales bacterium 10988]|nr:TonB-dependent receptor [Planctomycetales bacterium 10988]
MKRTSWGMTSLLFGCMVIPVFGQQTPPGQGDDTLDPTIVEGQPEGEVTEEPFLPPPTPPAPPSPIPYPNYSFSELNAARYPSLSDQMFDGLAGVTRQGGSVFDSPRSVSIITQQELIERAPIDMYQALEQETGILMQRTARGQSSPFVRGVTGNQVLILVDGIRMNNSTFRSGPNQYFNTIDPGQIEQIEILRGPGSVAYGSDAIGGVINIVTKSPSKFRGDYVGTSFRETLSTADWGSYSRLSVEGWVGSMGAYSGASYLNINDVDTGGILGRQPATNYDQHAADLKLQFQPACDQLLTVAFQHFVQEDVPRSDRFAPFIDPGSIRPTFFDPQQRDLAYLRWEARPEVGLMDSLMFTASYARQKEGSIEIRPTNNRRTIGDLDVNTIGLNLVGTTDLEFAGILSYGVDYYHDDVDAVRVRYRDDTGAFDRFDTPQFPDDAFYERFGIFVNWNVDLTDRWRFDGGVRYENIDLGATPILDINGSPTPVSTDPAFQGWIGSGALTYVMTDDLHLVGSVSEGFRAPNLDDLVATNPFVQQAGTDTPSLNLVSENSLTYEIGIKSNADRLHSQFFVFWTDLDNNILRNPPGGGNLLFSRSNRDSYIQGVEWSGEYVMDDGWSLYGNFAYIYGQDEVLDMPLSRIPPTQGIAGLRWRARDLSKWFDVYTWMVRRQDRLNFQDLSDARIPEGGTPGFATLNMRMGTRLGRCNNHRISLNLDNITDKAYRVHGSGVDGVGFNAIATYEWIR